MRQPNESELGLYFQTLLQDKFGKLLDWKKPQIQKTVGPFHPEIFDKFDQRRLLIISECKRVLIAFSDTDVAILANKDLPDDHAKREIWNNLLHTEIRKLHRDVPAWLAAGFGHSSYEADFEYWGQMATYDLREALILSVGVEPKYFRGGN